MSAGPTEDDEVKEALEQLMQAQASETATKEELADTVDDVKYLLENRGDRIEEVASQRDEYREYLLRVSDNLENFISENEDALGRLQTDLEDIVDQIDEIDPEEGRGYLENLPTFEYGLLHFAYDGASAAKRKLMGQPLRFRDRNGNEAVTPQGPGMTRRKVIGSGRDLLLGGILYGVWNDQDMAAPGAGSGGRSDKPCFVDRESFVDNIWKEDVEWKYQIFSEKTFNNLTDMEGVEFYGLLVNENPSADRNDSDYKRVFVDAEAAELGEDELSAIDKFSDIDRKYLDFEKNWNDIDDEYAAKLEEYGQEVDI